MATTGWKNPTAVTLDHNSGNTLNGAFLIDLDNIGTADATVTNEDGSAWVLKTGTSKTIATGTPMDSMSIEAENTIVQIVYTK